MNARQATVGVLQISVLFVLCGLLHYDGKESCGWSLKPNSQTEQVSAERLTWGFPFSWLVYTKAVGLESVPSGEIRSLPEWRKYALDAPGWFVQGKAFAGSLICALLTATMIYGTALLLRLKPEERRLALFNTRLLLTLLCGLGLGLLLSYLQERFNQPWQAYAGVTCGFIFLAGVSWVYRDYAGGLLMSAAFWFACFAGIQTSGELGSGAGYLDFGSMDWIIDLLPKMIICFVVSSIALTLLTFIRRIKKLKMQPEAPVP